MQCPGKASFQQAQVDYKTDYFEAFHYINLDFISLLSKN